MASEVSRLRERLSAAEEARDAAESRLATLRAEVERLREENSILRKGIVGTRGEVDEVKTQRDAAESRLDAATELLLRWLATLPENKTIGGHLADLLHESRDFLAAATELVRELSAGLEGPLAWRADAFLASQPAAPSLGHPGADDVFARLVRWHTELVDGRSGHSAYHVQSAAPARTVERLPPRTIPEDQLAPVACTEAEQRVLDAMADTVSIPIECLRAWAKDENFILQQAAAAELARRESQK